MALHQNLQQKLLQKLSPQQIQLMKLLQVPTAATDTCEPGGIAGPKVMLTELEFPVTVDPAGPDQL